MLEQVSRFQRTDQQVLEEVVGCSDTHQLIITHSILPPGEATPHDETQADKHLIVVRGTLALRIADQIIHPYEAGTIVTVPFGVTMEVRSAGPDPLEFFTIKALHPSTCPIQEEV